MIPWPLLDFIGLPCYEGLVDRQLPGANNAIGTDLIYGSQEHNLIQYQFFAWDVYLSAIPDSCTVRGRDQLESVQYTL